jgi:hypothetical protein
MRPLLLPAADKTSGLPVIASSPPLVRVTLASLEECNILLQNGLDFYGATFFPTEAAASTSVLRTSGRKSILGNRYSRMMTIRSTLLSWNLKFLHLYHKSSYLTRILRQLT